MSDNIDYDELDKAVNAAISARNATKAQSTPAQKPVATPKAPQKAAAKPAHRGVVMDFAPRKSVSPAPAKKAVAKRPAPAPIKRLASRPAVKPVTKTVAKPTIAAARPVSKPVMRPAAKPAPKPVEKAEPKEEPKPEPILKKREAPNANNYSLGGRSPFMTNAKVEKRPLGKRIPETSTSALRSTHNIYSQKNPARATENAKKHIVTQDPKKQSGWLWTLIVLGVILAGGGLGYLAYLLVFAH